MAKIIITNFAKQQLQQIYNYISWKTSDTIAVIETERIIKQIEYLEITPRIGRIVEELKILKPQHPQLVVIANGKTTLRTFNKRPKQKQKVNHFDRRPKT